MLLGGSCVLCRVPSSAHASCLGKCFGSDKGRRDGTQVAVGVAYHAASPCVCDCGGDLSFYGRVVNQ